MEQQGGGGYLSTVPERSWVDFKDPDKIKDVKTKIDKLLADITAKKGAIVSL
jgi:hypothetical protein